MRTEHLVIAADARVTVRGRIDRAERLRNKLRCTALKPLRERSPPDAPHINTAPMIVVGLVASFVGDVNRSCQLSPKANSAALT